MLRTLTHYWRIHVAVVLGAAVATAVLTGALLVGDSVRGSLRDLTLDRLGGIDSALLSDRFVRQDLAGDLDRASSIRAAAPAILLRGAAVHADAGTRASRVSILGLDDRFLELFGHEGGLRLERESGQVFPSIVINRSLATELDAAVGDAVVLSFGQTSDVPRDTLMGEKDPDDLLGRLRLVVTQVLPDQGIGRFGLQPNQHSPLNAYVQLPQLQRALDRRDLVNAVFVAHESADADPNARLAEVAGLEEMGLTVRREPDYLVVESDEFVLRPHADEALGEVASAIGAPLMRVQSYLANTIRAGERVLPYSLVAALDPLPGRPWARLALVDGSPAPSPGRDGILIDSWAAEDLGVGVGDEVELTYYVVGPREELSSESARLVVSGVVRKEGLAGDRRLTPDYPGIQDAADMSEWDPPFPVDLSLVREKDESYWDEHGATPKAFVAYETGKRLWSTRFGSTTSARLGPAPDVDLDATLERLRLGLIDELSLASFGLSFTGVKQEGLRASSGATDFAGLFVGFSMFLIVSAALLVALLFALGVEQRAGEVGVLFSVGYPSVKVRRQLVGQGGVLAVAGALLGVLGGVGYAWLMMAALRTLWIDAVGSSRLYLHASAGSLLTGFFGAVLVILFAIAMTVRRLRRLSAVALLAGSVRVPRRRRGDRVRRVLAWGSLVLALGLLARAVLSGKVDDAASAFGAGALLLISGLSFFTLWCRGERGWGLIGPGGALVSMAARNSAWSPGRSVLSVTLVATASFMIVAVGANRVEFGEELRERNSGSGGFPLLAASDVPLYQDLNRTDDRFELGFSAEDSSRLAGVEILPFRVLPGEDASCLNLYRPEKPRILGVPDELIERGGFDFQQHAALPEGLASPWELLRQPLEGEGVVPAVADFNSAMWILHLGLGQDLVMQDELGRPLRLRLVGLLRGSVFQSELLIAEDAFLEHFPGRGGYGYFMIDGPWEGAPDTAQLLESRLASFGFDAVSTAERLASYKVVEHTYMSTFQLLGGLGLLLGTVGLAVILVRNLIERRGELATMRAFGFRRASLARMVLVENGFLLLVGLFIGTVSALAAVAPRLATIHVPWLSLAATLALVATVGMLASLAAVRAALRIPLLPALKAD